MTACTWRRLNRCLSVMGTAFCALPLLIVRLTPPLKRSGCVCWWLTDRVSGTLLLPLLKNEWITGPGATRHSLPLDGGRGGAVMEVRWTSMPPNGGAADRRTPGGEQGRGRQTCHELP